MAVAFKTILLHCCWERCGWWVLLDSYDSSAHRLPFLLSFSSGVPGSSLALSPLILRKISFSIFLRIDLQWCGFVCMSLEHSHSLDVKSGLAVFCHICRHVFCSFWETISRHLNVIFLCSGCPLLLTTRLSSLLVECVHGAAQGCG